MRKLILAVLAVVSTLLVHAQGESGRQGLFTSNLKIYISIGVLGIILALIFAFLLGMERRLKKLENNNR